MGIAAVTDGCVVGQEGFDDVLVSAAHRRQQWVVPRSNPIIIISTPTIVTTFNILITTITTVATVTAAATVAVANGRGVAGVCANGACVGCWWGDRWVDAWVEEPKQLSVIGAGCWLGVRWMQVKVRVGMGK